MTFRHALGTAKFPGSVLREGFHEGLVEIFTEQSETGSIINVDEGTAPPEIAEMSSIEASPADAFSVTITLPFFAMQ
jgi:hypothetical protein